MLATLEHVLAAAGYAELRLNVWDTNVAGRGLYAGAGYELVEQAPGQAPAAETPSSDGLRSRLSKLGRARAAEPVAELEAEQAHRRVG